ncbi:hypothetical protein N8615_03395 [Verrucomicrobiales bacterium]|nr:hypothetical protein [Verrucomicrobiales bacterium]MDC0314386.1 hypothetical protein [bacterium]
MQDSFTYWDWAVVAAYLIFTTWIGHALRGKQSTIRDFFLGGRSLPWLAVCGSIIATEISALTFIGVPGTVFAVKGDFTYLQWALGSVMARVAVGVWLVPLYYREEIYSPYDYMGKKLGIGIKRLVTLLFSLGGILGASVRVLVTAVILKVVTPLEIHTCIIVIGMFAVFWTWMGGMRTVIWTDVIQFFMFVFGGLIALIWLISGVNGGWAEISESNREANVVTMTWNDKPAEFTSFQVNQEDGTSVRQIVIVKDNKGKPTLVGDVVVKGDELSVVVDQKTFPAEFKTKNKMKVIEMRLRDPETRSFFIFTFWIAIFAMPFQNFAAFGTDQLMAQRLFCCKDVSAARKAIIWSSASQLITILMLLVSAGLYAWYQQKGVSPTEFSLFSVETNNVFPIWITTVLPVGLSGLIVACAFAAAISSLDSILAALSQTTLSAIYGNDKFAHEEESGKMVWKSRLMVILWGITLTAVSILLYIPYRNGGSDLIGFAFKMVSYTYGPILGILLLAIFPVRSSVNGIVIGTILSIVLALLVGGDLSNVLNFFGVENASDIRVTAFPYPWLFPINAAITFFFGWIFAAGRAKS